MSDVNYRPRNYGRVILTRIVVAFLIMVCIGLAAEAAEPKLTQVACVSREVGQSVLDAYKESQEQGDLTLTLYVLLGACEIVPEPVKTET